LGLIDVAITHGVTVKVWTINERHRLCRTEFFTNADV